MPFKSEAQRDHFKKMLNEKKITQEAFSDWEKDTPSKASLPSRVRVKDAAPPPKAPSLRSAPTLKRVKGLK